jgi:hypothetical protein
MDHHNTVCRAGGRSLLLCSWDDFLAAPEPSQFIEVARAFERGGWSDGARFCIGYAMLGFCDACSRLHSPESACGKLL